MKRVVCILIIVVCIVISALFTYVKHTENELNQNGDDMVLVDRERTQEEKADVKWELIKSTMKEDLENRKEVEEVFIGPESEVVEIKVTLQEGYSMNQELEEEIQSYVMAATNCKQVIVTVGIN